LRAAGAGASAGDASFAGLFSARLARRTPDRWSSDRAETVLPALSSIVSLLHRIIAAWAAAAIKVQGSFEHVCIGGCSPRVPCIGLKVQTSRDRKRQASLGMPEILRMAVPRDLRRH